MTGLSGGASIVNYFVQHSGQTPDVLNTWSRIFLSFYLGAEYNLPTWYASVSLLTCAGLLALTAAVLGRSHRYYRHWWALAVVFVALSIDEYVSVHEALGGYLHNWFDLGGIFNYSWPILGIVFIGCLSVAYFRFFLDLPPRFRNLLIVAAVIYVSGAMGMEVLEGYYAYLYGPEHLAFEVMIYIEEVMEMAGVAIFIVALYWHLRYWLKDRPLELTLQ